MKPQVSTHGIGALPSLASDATVLWFAHPKILSTMLPPHPQSPKKKEGFDTGNAEVTPMSLTDGLTQQHTTGIENYECNIVREFEVYKCY